MKTLDSRSARLLVLDRQAEKVHYSPKVNIDDDEHRAYVDYYVNACPWRPELQEKAPGRFYSTRLDFTCSQESFYRTEFFNDWARHLDIHHGLLGTVFRDQRYTVQLLVQRTRGQGHFSRARAESMGQLLPHIQQALRLSRGLAEERSRNAAALAASEQSTLPFLLFTEQGRMAYASGSARAALARLPGVNIRDERLHFEHAALAERFGRMMARLSRKPVSGIQGAGDSMDIPRPEGPPARLFASVLEAGARESPLWPCPAQVLVYVQQPTECADIDRDVLTRLYGLSPAEASIAALVACGYTPTEIATHNGCSPHTVRTQLKAAFRKTETRRQSELAALVLQSPAVGRAGPQAPPVTLVQEQ